jgi:drug/metabolite transporter (DMT)-like permease
VEILLLLGLSTVLWGMWGIANNLALNGANPYFVQLMYSIPYVISMPLFWWLNAQEKTPNTNPQSATLWALFAGMSGLGAFITFLIAQQRGAPPSIATAITSSYPVIVLILALLARQETFTWTKALGVGVIVLGVCILAFGQPASAG